MARDVSVDHYTIVLRGIAPVEATIQVSKESPSGRPIDKDEAREIALNVWRQADWETDYGNVDRLEAEVQK